MDMINPRGRIVSVPKDKVDAYKRFGYRELKRNILPSGYRDKIEDVCSGETICLFRDFGGIGDIVIQSFLIKTILDQYPDISVDYAIPHLFHSLFEKTNHPRFRLLDYTDVLCKEIHRRDKQCEEIHSRYALFKDISRPCIKYERALVDNNMSCMKPINRLEMWAYHVGIDIPDNPSSILHVDPDDIPELPAKSVGIAYRSNMPVKDWTELVRVYQYLEENGYIPFFIDNRVIGSYRFIEANSLYDLLASVNAFDFIISVDTAVFHIAGAFNKPVVGLFNINDGEAYSKYYPSASFINTCIKEKPCIGTCTESCDAMVSGSCYPVDPLPLLVPELLRREMISDVSDHHAFTLNYIAKTEEVIKQAKICVFLPTFNRKFILEYTLPRLRLAFKDAYIMMFDDCSTEFGIDYLMQYADKVYRNDRNIGVSRSFNDMLVRVPWQEFDYIYKTDSDALCDPGLLDRLMDLSMLNNNAPVCCYNSRHHFRFRVGKAAHGNAEYRSNCPGISMFIPADIFGKINQFHIPKNSAFDHEITKQLPNFVVSNISFVEHLGAGGMHSQAHDWNMDIACNPTEYLVNARRVFLRGIGVDI